MRRAVLVVLTAGLLLAQRGRSVDGTVTDLAGNKLPGSVVQVENTVTLNIQSYITRADGEYHFKDLSPDVDFVLRAHYKQWWSKEATLSKFREAREARINLVIPTE